MGRRQAKSYGSLPAVVLAVRRILCALTVLALCSSPAFPNKAEEAKRVLILFSDESLLPANNALGSSLQAMLRAEAPGRLEIYTEFLDAGRFPGSAQEARMAAFLEGKYATIPIDLLIAAGPQALGFLAERGAALFPGVPIVFSGISEETYGRLTLPPHATGVVSRFDPARTLGLALRLQPDARQVVVVTGASPFDKRWEAVAREKLRPYGDRLQLTYLAGLPLSQLLQKLAALPHDTIVIYLTMLADGTGERFIPRDIAARIATTAGAPVYSVYETYLGQGIVGGYIDGFHEMGEATARIGLRVLAGEDLESLSPWRVANHRFMVDWRQLQRWRLSETRLPPNTLVLFRAPSLWSEYREQIIAVIVVLLIQSVLIAALLIQARRRRQAEASLRASEESVNLAAESANLGLWRMDVATYRIWATEHCRRMLGLDGRATVTRQSFIDAVHPEDRDRATRTCEESLAQGRSYEMEYRLADADGQVRWILDRTKNFPDAAGKSQRMSGVIIDITERKRTEEALRESEERYRNVVETQTELICRYLPDTTLTFVNDAYCRYFGKPREELVGKKFFALIPEAQHAAIFRYIARLMADPRAETHEHQVIRADGSTGWQQWTDHVIRGPDGRVVELQGIGRDITELKQAEIEAQERREEVTHLTRVAVLGELTGAFAHELNQPLTAILSNAQAAQLLLAREPIDLAEIRDILDDIIHADRRAGEVIDHLRALLRKEEAKFQSLDLDRVVTDVLDLVRSELIERNIVATTQLAAGPPRAFGDRVQLQQVLLNLIMNACEAMGTTRPAERRLSISTGSDGNGSMEVWITDSGTGVPNGLADRVFEPFFSTKTTGIGLGLSICRSIVAAHGGRLWVENGLDRGATFKFTLPVQNGEHA